MYEYDLEEEYDEYDSEEEYKIIPIYHQIRFIDSFKLMDTNLDSLVNNLSKKRFC